MKAVNIMRFIAFLCFVAVWLLPLTARAQYQITQVSTQPTVDYRWPSINNSGDMVWCKQVGGYWHVFKNDVQITFGSNNHIHPSISDSGEIVYVKDGVGGGVGRQVIRHSDKAVIEFSSSGGLGFRRNAGFYSGIASNGNIISNYEFFGFDSVRRLKTTAKGQFPGNFYPYYDHPDVNSDGDVVFADVYFGGIYIGKESDLASQEFFGSRITEVASGFFPRVADRINGEKPEIVYISSDRVRSTKHGTVDSGKWADINNSGDVLYEKVVNGKSQIFIASRPGTDFEIVSVEGCTNIGGQFTFITTDPITIKASIGDRQAGQEVKWTVTGTGAASSLIFATNVVALTDASGISTFRFRPEDIGNWRIFAHPELVEGSYRKNLPIGFDVKAINSQGEETTLAKSGIGILKQDEADTLRQEYVDYRYWGTTITPPDRDTLKDSSMLSHGFRGNYSLQPDAAVIKKKFEDINNAYRIAIQGRTIDYNGKRAVLEAASVSITSGYRNPQRNRVVGGAVNSDHQKGRAFDLVPAPHILLSGLGPVRQRIILDKHHEVMHKYLYPALHKAASQPGNTAKAELGNGKFVGPDLPCPAGWTPDKKKADCVDHIHVSW